MSKGKLKTELLTKKTTKSLALPSKNAIDAMTTLWSAEVTLMQQKSFASETEAVEYLVDRVADKLSINLPGDVEHKDFVRDLILSNVEMMKIIQESCAR